MPVKRLQHLEGPALAFVTTTVVKWLPVFTDISAADIAVTELGKTADQFDAGIVGYVVMPSHIHVLLGLPEVKQISAFMQTYKSITSRRIKLLSLGGLQNLLWQSGNFRLWQRRFDDVIVRSERQFRIKLNYIHNNPVKNGLVRNPEAWLYSSAADWSEESAGPISIDRSFGWVKRE